MTSPHLAKLVAEANQRLTRSDCFWVAEPGGGMALVQSRAWTANRTSKLETAREEQRERWKYRHENPIASQEEMFDD